MIEAKIICDSIGEHSPRLTTFLTRYPKFIHAEHMRHRAGSYCVSSSRAIPVSKNLAEVRSDELRAAPVFWGREQKGMASSVELNSSTHINDTVYYDYMGRGSVTEKQRAELEWKRTALLVADRAEFLMLNLVHKSIVNRLLEPFLHVNCLMTIAEPGLLNFFGLRLNKSAQPEIRMLAEAMWRAWNEGNPKTLKLGEWHLPFLDNYHFIDSGESVEETIKEMIKVSVARCARLSYTSFETGKSSTIEEDLALYERLINARPIHASPAEHQATPDRWFDFVDESIGESHWQHPELAGNLGPGWVQYRKMLPGESIAPLPEGYSHV